MKIKRGDTVLVICGKYRGKIGKVLRAFPKERRLLVEGVNIRKKHQRPKRSGEKGEIVKILSPIDISNVKLVCPKCQKATRVGYVVTEKGKYRICKKCKKRI
ncbi:50S ribosomal protein L24 [bacterium]|nr:50S ribosomal protein L24 [bacterium]